jgi:hypothetical protein
MAYDLSVVRDNVRNRLDDEDYEQEFLDRAINYAQWKITNKYHLKFMEDTDTLAVSQADIDVALPADHHETLYLRVTSPVAMRANITNNFWNYADFIDSYISPSANPQSMPYNWSEYARRIKFATPADRAYTLTIDYLRKSSKLTIDTDVPDIPEEFQELLELGAYMRIAKREDDYDVKSQEQIDYNEMLADLLHVYGRSKQPGGLRTMRVSKRR